MPKRHHCGKAMLSRAHHHSINDNESSRVLSTQHLPSTAVAVRMRKKQQLQQWQFYVGGAVDARSWGKRTTTTTTTTTSLTTIIDASATDPWKASDFLILNKLGEGHFGSVYYAKLYGADASVKEQEQEDVRDDDDPDTFLATACETDVALKRFDMSKLRNSEQQGSRAMELLRREVNIHTQ